MDKEESMENFRKHFFFFIWTGVGIHVCVGYLNEVFMAAAHLESAMTDTNNIHTDEKKFFCFSGCDG